MLLSTSQREVSTSPLHARVPLADLPRDQVCTVRMYVLVTTSPLHARVPLADLPRDQVCTVRMYVLVTTWLLGRNVFTDRGERSVNTLYAI